VKSALLVPIAAAVLLSSAQAAVQTTTLAMLNDGIREVRLSSAKATAETSPSSGMVFVAAGEVTVGTTLDDIEYLGDGNDELIAQYMAEVPQHTVPLEPFFIDRTEVTNLQWRVYLDATGREPSSYLVEYGWGGNSFAEGDEMLPIGNVSFTEVMDFLAWAGKRLPTEPEWTLAARGASDTRAYPWGDRWQRDNCQNAAMTPSQPTAVGSFPKGASPFGALDMCGNVWEWVDSSYSAFDGFEPWRVKKGRKAKTIAPEFNRSYRVAKGGSFANARNDMRIDMRLSMHPGENDASLGFRGARSLIAGVDVVTHAHGRLLPPSLSGVESLDLTDVVAKEVTSYAHDGEIVTGHRWLAFAHPVAKKGSGLAKLRKDSREEPVALGLLTTSEPLAKPQLPPGDYFLAYKGLGESKAHKEKRRNEKSSGKKKEEEAPPPPPVMDALGTGTGASSPWPGVGASAIIEDIDFPQDKEVILFYNVNNAVVGYTLLPDAIETTKSPAILTDEGDGKRWTISYSHDNMPRNKKMPRFAIELELYGEGLQD
jgi:iron(II)-dependent oxidoreductase